MTVFNVKSIFQSTISLPEEQAAQAGGPPTGSVYRLMNYHSLRPAPHWNSQQTLERWVNGVEPHPVKV